jgi:hypothetical protein
MTHKSIALILSMGMAASPAWADDPIATDRPDFVESSQTVGLGRWQIETSVAWEQDEDGAFEASASSTPTLLRYGFAEHWELRFETDGLIDAELRGPGLRVDEDGVADLAVGLKYHVPGSGENGGPSMAWLMHVDLDTGSSAFRGDGARPSLRLVAEWELPNDMSLGVMPGVIYDNGDEGRYAAGESSASWSARAGPIASAPSQNWRCRRSRAAATAERRPRSTSAAPTSSTTARNGTSPVRWVSTTARPTLA